ncbi:MAG TPA: glycosyltransferase family 4 protein [Actinomycetota bacterium]|nr:glycosyltransferase family 4 protein [Actinomycetota bacterium]
MAGPHVLIVVENIGFGDDTRVRKQVTSLLDAGFRVSVVSPRAEANAEFRGREGLRVHEYAPPPSGTGAIAYLVEYAYALLASAILGMRARRVARFDVVQLCVPPDVFFILGWVFRAAGARIVVDQRDLLSELYAARYGKEASRVPAVLRRLEGVSQRSADRVLVVNPTLEERALHVSGVERGRVAIVRNGPVLANVERARPDVALREGKRMLACWTGVMGRQDRLDLMLDAIASLIHTRGRTDCLFALVGDGETLRDVRDRARSLGVEAWVRFPGWVDEETLFRYLATADLGLDATLQHEVSPVKAVEYMAFGVPFVAFDLPETRRTGGGAAVYAAPGDVEGLASAIEHLLRDDDERRARGDLGRIRVERELAWDRQADVYVATIAALSADASPTEAVTGS